MEGCTKRFCAEWATPSKNEMNQSKHIENPDVVLIGSGIMSGNLGAMLKCLDPGLSIQVYEVTEGLSQESSDGWNNAGTGHAGICELSYTPHRQADGTCSTLSVRGGEGIEQCNKLCKAR